MKVISMENNMTMPNGRRQYNPHAVVIRFFLLFPLFFFISQICAFADTTVGGTIATDTVWSLAGSPYIVTSNIIVQGTDGDDGITTLRIEPGVRVSFNSGRSLAIGAGSGSPGALSSLSWPVRTTCPWMLPAISTWPTHSIIESER